MKKRDILKGKSVGLKKKLSGSTRRFAAASLAAFMAAGVMFGGVPTGVSAAETQTTASSASTKVYSNQDALKKYDKITGISDDTILGLDFSEYQEVLGWGKTLKDFKSEAIEDIFSYVKSKGVNTISVKAAVSPSETDAAALSLETNMKTLKAAQEAGLKTNLVLLYSDAMTYASVQTLPDGWTAENAEEKAIAYTKEVLAKLTAAGVTPTMITIGNEVNYNFLNMSADGGWNGFIAMEKIAKLVQEQNIKAAFSVSCSDADGIQWVMQKLSYAAADESVGLEKAYDCIGLNIYPSSDNDMNAYMATARDTFNGEESRPEGAQLIISGVKCAHYNENDADVTEASQAKQIYNLLASVINEQNAGGIICNNAVITGDYNSFFDDEGEGFYSLAIFAYAKGNQVDTETWRNPFKYGGESGLKEQKVNISKVSGMTDSSIQGVDVSSYVALMKAGVKFYDNDGNEAPLLKVLSDNGINYLRVRVWNDPVNDKGETYGGGANDLDTAVTIAKEAKKYGMKILLCLHYSDFWADPSQQLLPKAWKADENDAEKMSQHVYDFTKECIEKISATGAEIGMVQVGNEITNGMLGQTINRDKGGSYKAVWGDETKSKLIDRYLNAGARAVRDTAPDALIALHLETPNVDKYSDIMACWERDNVDYDVLGSSYYPFWGNNGENTPETLKKVEQLAASKGKLFAVLETAWVATLEDADGTPNAIGEGNGNGTFSTDAYDVSPQGQVDMLSEMYDTIMSEDNGLGAFYWEPAWIPVYPGYKYWAENKAAADEYGTGWASKGAVGYANDDKMYYWGKEAWGGTTADNWALFDFNGYPLDSLRFYKDAVTDEKIQLTVIRHVDSEGNSIGTDEFIKVGVGESKVYTAAEIDGYETEDAKTMTITGEKEGTAVVKVSYKKKESKKDDTTKTKKTQSIVIKKSSYKAASGSSLNLGKLAAAKGTLTFKSGNTKVAAVDSATGKLTAKTPGIVKIMISAAATDDYKAASKTITVIVVPKKQIIKKLSASGKSVKVTVKKDSKASGYEVQTSLNKSFTKDVRKSSTANVKKTALTVKKLKSKKTYYVRVRSYKKIGNKKYYGAWSKVKKIKVK